MPTLIEARVSNGKFLYVFAWIVELCAASAGFLFAYLALTKSGQQDIGNQTPSDIRLILATIPFVIVGIVELTKIPLVSACYLSPSRVGKYLFGLSLILVSLITFETFLNGFQQGLQIRLTGLKKIKKEIKATTVEIKALEKEKNNLDGLTLQQIDNEFTDRIRNLNIRKKEEINSIQKERENDESRLGGPQQKIIEQELKSLREEYKSLTLQYQSRKNTAKQTFEQKILGLQDDTKSKKGELSGRIKNKNLEIKNKTSEIKQKEKQINKIRGAGFSDNKELKERRSGLTNEIKQKEKQINKIRGAGFSDNKELKERRSGLTNEIKQKEKQINKIRGAGFSDNKELKEIRSRYKRQRSNIGKTIDSRKGLLKDREKELQDDLEKIKQELVGKYEWANQDLVAKREKKLSELDEIRTKRMNLDIQSQLDGLDNQEKKEIENTKEKIKQEISKRIQGLQNDIATIRNELAALREKNKQEKSERTQELQNDIATIRNILAALGKKNKQEKSERIQELQNDVATIRKELAALKIDEEGLSLERTKITIGGQRQDFLNKKTERIRGLNAELSELQKKKNEQINNKQALLSKVIFDNQGDLEPRIQAHRRAIDNIKKEIRKEKKEVNKRKQENIRDYNRRDKRIEDIINRLAILNKSHSTYEEKLSDEADKTLIGQWTKFWFQNINPSNLKTVATIWFGSLAAITAFMGTVLAFASMVLRYGHVQEKKPSRITRAIQRYFSVARKIKRKPKIIEIEKEVEKIIEVVKEVPVTKIEIQEVPKEVIRKHIVHVPIASDDLNILDFDKKLSGKSKEDRKTTDDKDNPKFKT